LLETKVIGFSRSGDIYIFLTPKQELELSGIEHQFRELYNKLNICLCAGKIETQLQKLLDLGIMSTEDLTKIQKQVKSRMLGFRSTELQENIDKLLAFKPRVNILGKVFGR